MAQVPGTAKNRCAQLLIPNERTSVSPSNSQMRMDVSRHGTNASKCIRSLFEENLDRLKEYIDITRQYNCTFRSFSTSDILDHHQSNSELDTTLLAKKKYCSECDLTTFGKYHINKEVRNDYITYSCSTLAICGDTMHSSQLPSPQAQSIRQINSFIFSDLDLIMSISKKVRNQCLKQRMTEFLKNVNVDLLQENELRNITKLTTNVPGLQSILTKNYDNNQYVATESGDILIHVVDYENEKEKTNWVTKRDKEMFVLNWLQTVESCSLEPV